MSLDHQKAANDLRKQLSKNVVENREFAEVIAIVIPQMKWNLAA